MKPWLLRLGAASMLALVSAAAGHVGAQNNSPQATAAVNIIEPELYITRLDSGQEARLPAAASLAMGEILRTDDHGVALITWFYDGTETVLGPGSMLKVRTLTGDAQTTFVIDLDLPFGHLVSGLGSAAGANPAGRWVLTTPAFIVRLVAGQFEVMVADDGLTRVIVTEGSVEIAAGNGAPLAVSANQFVSGRPGAQPEGPQPLTPDGITPALDDLCSATANTNLNIRLAPNENSRRLAGMVSEQRFWVRSATDSNLWLQIYVQTDPSDEEAHNFGWVYGPATTLDEAHCGQLIRTPLDAVLYGGPGIIGTSQPAPVEPPAAPPESPPATEAAE